MMFHCLLKGFTKMLLHLISLKFFYIPINTYVCVSVSTVFILSGAMCVLLITQTTLKHTTGPQCISSVSSAPQPPLNTVCPLPALAIK